MDNLKSLILPAFLGLAAGMAHGFISHQAGLPMALTDQVMGTLVTPQAVSNSFYD